MLVVGIAVLLLVLFSAAGLAIVSSLPLALRRSLLGAAPLLAVAVLVLVLHGVTLIMPIGPAALPIAALVAVPLILALIRRHSLRSLRPGRTQIATIIGAVTAMLLALGPSIVANTSRLIALGGYDGFYYVSVARWLATHSATVVPQMGANPDGGVDAPGFEPAYATAVKSLRYGQELLHAWLSSLLGIDPADLAMPWLAVSVALIVLAAGWLLSVWGVRRRYAPVAATVIGSSIGILSQYAAHNADSLLGIALALATLAAATRTIRLGGPWIGWAIVTGVLLAATIGVYIEVVVFLGPALAILSLFAGRQPWGRRLLRPLLVVGVSLAVGPTAWVRGITGIATVRQYSGNPDPAPLGAAQSLAELAGDFLAPFREPAPSLLSVLGAVAVLILAALALVGVVAAVRSVTTRVFAIAVLLPAVPIFAYLAATSGIYVYQRSVDMLTPIAMCVVAIGLDRVSRAPAVLPTAIRRGSAPLAGALAAVTSLSLWAPSVFADHAETTLGEEFDQAAAWVHPRVDDGGVAVLDGDFFEQLGLAESLADSPDVDYPYLRGDLGYLAEGMPESFWSGGDERYLLVGAGVASSVAPDAEVADNARFVLVDRRRGGIAVVSPFAPNRLWQPSPTPGGVYPAESGASLLIWVSPDVEDVSIVLGGCDGAPSPPQVGRVEFDEPGWSAVASSNRIEVTRDEDAGAHTVITVELAHSSDAGTDGSCFVLEGVGRG